MTLDSCSPVVLQTTAAFSVMSDPARNERGLYICWCFAILSEKLGVLDLSNDGIARTTERNGPGLRTDHRMRVPLRRCAAEALGASTPCDAMKMKTLVALARVVMAKRERGMMLQRPRRNPDQLSQVGSPSSACYSCTRTLKAFPKTIRVDQGSELGYRTIDLCVAPAASRWTSHWPPS